MTHRIHNFCAGPCTLPLTVLEEARAELTDFQGSGMSVLEISHRSARFEALHEETLALAHRLIGAPDDFQALLLPGGAHQQFDMIPLNLLADGGSAAYIDSGVWADKALKEAERVGQAQAIWSGRDGGYSTLPDSLPALPADCRYLYLTSNETVNGIQYRNYPEAAAPLVIDASSDYYTRADIPWTRCAIVYGASPSSSSAATCSKTTRACRASLPTPRTPPPTASTTPRPPGKSTCCTKSCNGLSAQAASFTLTAPAPKNPRCSTNTSTKATTTATPSRRSTARAPTSSSAPAAPNWTPASGRKQKKTASPA